MKISNEVLKKALHLCEKPIDQWDLQDKLSIGYSESYRLTDYLIKYNYVKYERSGNTNGYKITPIGLSFRNDLDLA